MNSQLVRRLGAAAIAAGIMSGCSDSTTAPSAEALVARKAAGPIANVGPVQLSYNSGADATEFCSKTADDVFSSAVGGCVASVLAPLTTLNPGWTAAIAGASWISWVSNGDAYVSPPASYTYRKQFTVPAGVTDQVLNVEVGADNGVAVYLNGNPIGATAVGQNIFAATQKYAATAGDFVPGTNNLVFVVENTRVPINGTLTPTPVGQACPPRPALYANGAYDAVACYNPTGMIYAATVSWIVPPPPPAGGQGCSPGYWKTHNFPATYSKNQLFSSIFENAFPGMTLQQVLEQGGGGIKALGRHTVSAFFNAVALGSNYELTQQQVIDKFNAANPNGDIDGLINEFSALQDVNGRLCPNPTGK